MSRYMYNGLSCNNVCVYYVRIKITRHGAKEYKQSDGRHNGEMFQGDNADNLMTFERMVTLDKYHHVIIPLAIKQATNVQCLVQVSIRCSEHYSLCRRHCEDMAIVTAPNKITNHRSVFYCNTQQNTVDNPSPATQYIVSFSNLLICGRGLSQPREKPDTRVLNVTVDKGY